jgi:hypothetical protein
VITIRRNVITLLSTFSRSVCGSALEHAPRQEGARIAVAVHLKGAIAAIGLGAHRPRLALSRRSLTSKGRKGCKLSAGKQLPIYWARRLFFAITLIWN